MDWVPSECLASIIQYLCHSDRLRARAVCKQWHRAVNEWSLLNRGTFLLRKDYQWTFFFSSKGPYLFASIKYLHCDSVSLHYDRYRLQWDTLLPRLHGLSLISTDISSGDFISILSACHSLRSLHLVRLRYLFLSGVVLNKEEDVSRLAESLRRVKDLNLSENRYMSDFIFSRLVHCAKELESLDVSGCNILNGACTPTSVFTFPEIIKTISKCPHLKALNLSSTGLDDKGLVELSSLSFILKKLNLSNCSGISGYGLLKLLESQKKLETLNLDHCHRWISIINEDKMVDIASALAKIPHVSLAGLYISDEWSEYSNKLFKTLSKGNAWRELNVSGAKVPGESLIHTFSTNGILSHLRHLVMSDFSSCFSSRQFLTLFTLSKDLVSLNLNGCTNVSNSVVILISSHLKHLEILCLNGCITVSDLGLGTPETQSFIQSQIADEESFFHELSHDGLLRSDTSIRNLTKLRELHLASLKISTSSICHSFFFKDLSKIDVSYCFSLDDLSFVFLGEQCPRLSSIIAKKCSLSDVGFIALTKRLKILQEIDVEGNQFLSSHALEELPNNCVYLKVLNISHCYKINQDSVTKIEKAYFNITVLRHMYSSNEVTDESFHDPLITFKKSRKFKPWKLLCCVSKPRDTSTIHN